MDGGAEVLNGSTVRVRGDVEVIGSAGDDGSLGANDIDGRLGLSSSTELVLAVKSVPVDGTLKLMVPEASLSSLSESKVTRSQRCAVMADSSGH